MRTYVTLFDTKYLPKGLVLIKTLFEHSSKPYTLKILALDNGCEIILKRLKEGCSENYEVFTVDQIMSEKLLEAKNNRTYQEWCWTLASYFTNWIIRQGFDGDEILEGRSSIAYLDSDMMFYADPEIIHREIGDREIGIIPHRLIPEKKYLECNGIYNVSWVSFRGETGLSCLDTWAEQCLEWCYNRVEPDRFADQKYLDSWVKMYGLKVCVIENIGVGLAPWNLANYRVENRQDGPYVDNIKAILYHYHELSELPGREIKLTNYHLRPMDIETFYDPYLKEYFKAEEVIRRITR